MPIGQAQASRAKPGAAAIGDGPWVAELSCERFEQFPAMHTSLSATAKGNELTIARGTAEQPGYFWLAGTRTRDGSLKLEGHMIVGAGPAFGRRLRMVFNASADAGRIYAEGNIGKRQCTLDIARR